ncbi:TPA: hypothetical protein ACFOIE_001986 [Neisseria meningitidis]
MPSEHFSDGMMEKKTRLSAPAPEILRQCGLETFAKSPKIP